jgi:nucleolar complex protein 3
VKKDTLQLRTEENVLLASYKRFLAHLEKLLAPITRRRGQKNQATPQAVKLAVISLQCLTQMVVARPYFNFSANLIRLLVPFLDHRLPEARDVVSKAISEILRDDKKGEISFEVNIKI